MLPEPLFWTVHMYGIMVALGVLASLIVLNHYGKRVGLAPKMLDFAYYDVIASIVFGFASAAFFQGLYEFIAYPERGFHVSIDNITFIGGLIGGTLCFLIAYLIFRKKLPENLKGVMTVVPCSITVAHGFGRIGCFFAGCCYGKPTDSFLGVKFPELACKVHPTQLYEAAFLFALFAVLSVLLFKRKEKYNFPIYLIAYGVFRFLIEFLRDDERGAFVGRLSPSQFWSILMIAAGIVWAVLIRTKQKDAAAPQEENESVPEEEESTSQEEGVPQEEESVPQEETVSASKEEAESTPESE